jgi:hypothetical protein
MSRIEELSRGIRVFDEPENLAHNLNLGLYDLLRHIDLPKDQVVIGDIGCYSGVTTEMFALSANKVYAVDDWAMTEEIQDGRRLEKAERLLDEVRAKYSNVTKIKVDTIKGADLFDIQCFDLVYLDGVHTYDIVRRRIEAYLPKVKMGGYLAVHDYHIPDVSRAFRDVLGEPTNVFYDQSALYRRPGNYNPIQFSSVLVEFKPTPTPQPEATPEVKPTATPKPVETKKVEFIKEIKPTETK